MKRIFSIATLAACDGLDGLGAKVAAVGKACGACHKPYRAKKK